MLSKLINHSPDKINNFVRETPPFNHGVESDFVNIAVSEPQQLTDHHVLKQQTIFAFEVSFTGRMDMYSDLETVMEYLNAHQVWFKRCAQPMKVEPLTENGYILTVGKYGSFGYEVEPKIAVVLHPPVDRVYQMHTIPLPDAACQGYEVQYNASMKLTEQNLTLDQIKPQNKGLFSKQQVLPSIITQVSWELDLQVEVEFPQFMTKLSPKLIQATGDRLLAQIVRQVSPRLTYKVQQDFHNSYNLPIPSASSRQISQVTKLRSL